MNTEDREEFSTDEAKSYGGYSAQLHYKEKQERKKNVQRTVIQGVVLFFLCAFSIVGVLALSRGFFFEDSAKSGGEAGTIKVPTQQELDDAVKEPEEVLEEVGVALVTVEAVLDDGSSRYGSGFILSQEGYALCSTALFDGIQPTEIRAHTSIGISYVAIPEGSVQELGFVLLRLDGAFGAEAIRVGNYSFVKRGETLFAAAPENLAEFPGTALSGIVASKTAGVKISLNGKAASVPVLFLDVAPNESLWGSPVVNQSGSAIGFCSPAIKSPYGNLTAVVSIHVVYTMVNDMLGD